VPPSAARVIVPLIVAGAVSAIVPGPNFDKPIEPNTPSLMPPENVTV